MWKFWSVSLWCADLFSQYEIPNNKSDGNKNNLNENKKNIKFKIPSIPRLHTCVVGPT